MPATLSPKQKEIEILKKAAEDIQKIDGYTGEWLKDQIPFIESEIRADLLPGMYSTTFAELRKNVAKQCAKELKVARYEAEKIIRDAQNQSAKLLKETNEKCDAIQKDTTRWRNELWETARRIQSHLED